jgi:broad specificity phosphatase PhoE
MPHQINLYFIRHAHVAYYTDQGSRYNVPHFKHHLTPLGWAQALELDYLLAESGIKFSKIYSSPYARAVETITPFSIRTQKSIEIKWDLREIYTGATYNLWDEVMHKNPHDHIGDGESKIGVLARFNREIHEILKIANAGENIIIVSHGAIMECFLEHFFPDQKTVMSWPDAYKVVFKHGHFYDFKKLTELVPQNISTHKDLKIYPKLVMGEE